MSSQQQSLVDTQPLTPEQKHTLIATYQRTANMTVAMHAAGIKSPRTAYLWWHRFWEEGEAGLAPRSHARKTQQTVPVGIATSICELRHAHPDWGRRRLTEAVTRIYGQRLVSPSGVEAVLRRAHLWEQGPLQRGSSDDPLAYDPQWMKDGRIDEEQLLTCIQHGLALSFSGNARAALFVLQNQVWNPLQRDRIVWNGLMTTREMGKWLLRSRVMLAHSYMNTGRWDQARSLLEETLAWMQEQDSWLRQQPWEEEGAVNLRWGDAWVECQQYLGIVLQATDDERAQGHLHTAVTGMQRRWKPIVPKDPQALLSNVRRDIASLKIESGRVQDQELERDLDLILAGLDPVYLVPGKEAGIAIL